MQKNKQTNKKKLGVTDFVSEIKRVENYLILKIQRGLHGFIGKNIECESKEANDLTRIVTALKTTGGGAIQ